MFLKKEILSSSFKLANAKNITRIWASDGWCYIPEFGERQKFIYRSSDVFEFIKETWDGIIPSAENIESVQIMKMPTAWIEKTEWSCERFEQTTANSNN